MQAAVEAVAKGDAPAPKKGKLAAAAANATTAYNGDVVFTGASKAIQVSQPQPRTMIHPSCRLLFQYPRSLQPSLA